MTQIVTAGDIREQCEFEIQSEFGSDAIVNFKKYALDGQVQKEIEKSVLLSAIKKYKIMNDKPNPVSL